ncbi:carbamoyltransferase HypF [Sulfuriferula thiophila]|uniref:carbamoyltransferase HypF n=1 Tax=Sulfuriferula thiophila TaxID=1781211 RepID=UPI000F608221|nr:carbamoyltransferase HypF [Sulfuriferula thiophila]
MNSSAAVHFVVSGRVQGVGFRPFVFRLAQRFGLSGWVQNRLGLVEIQVEGSLPHLAAFAAALLGEAPPLAQPSILAQMKTPATGASGFAIRPSVSDAQADIHVPPDYFTCDDCLTELFDPQNRRYRYPFINCTQCGPRYTLIEHLPYDRATTSMRGFELCPTCRAEYENPLDRRFHAEPVACPQCGPQLLFKNDRLTLIGAGALAAAVAALRAGQIVAVKDVGGYHLLCDARSDAVVARLRERKVRPHKPLAVMFPDLASMQHDAALSEDEAVFLTSPLRPILLANQREGSLLSAHIAPGLTEIGVMLPYSPLHHLLLADFGGPLVATSANISGEPVLTDNAETETRLTGVADAFLHHDRPIVRPADDPVFRFSAGIARPLRLGRGCAPLELELPFALDTPLLAVGGHTKNTIALAWGRRVVISPHIGELGSLRSMMVFEQVIADLQKLYGVTASRVVCDAHSGYASSRWARNSGLTLNTVFHHHAHASALAGEYPDISEWLVFTWDGVGYGEDGTMWGGEALLGKPGNWMRAASMRPFYLPGGDTAGREPWRAAAALAWETGMAWPELPADSALVHAVWQRRLNTQQTSAVGRLFDAVAAFTGLSSHASFEGQGPMYLEAACTGSVCDAITLPLSRDEEGVWRSDWAPLVAMLLDATLSVSQRADLFHTSMAHALLAQVRAVQAIHPVQCVGLAGGVFQNRRLTELVVNLLTEAGVKVRLAQRVPINDGGISFGQIIEAGYRHE